MSACPRSGACAAGLSRTRCSWCRSPMACTYNMGWRASCSSSLTPVCGRRPRPLCPRVLLVPLFLEYSTVSTVARVRRAAARCSMSCLAERHCVAPRCRCPRTALHRRPPTLAALPCRSCGSCAPRVTAVCVGTRRPASCRPRALVRAACSEVGGALAAAVARRPLARVRVRRRSVRACLSRPRAPARAPYSLRPAEQRAPAPGRAPAAGT